MAGWTQDTRELSRSCCSVRRRWSRSSTAFDSVFEYDRGTGSSARHPRTVPDASPVGTRPGHDRLGAVRVRARAGRPRRSHRGPLPAASLRGRVARAAAPPNQPRPARPPPPRLPVRLARLHFSAPLRDRLARTRTGRLAARDYLRVLGPQPPTRPSAGTRGRVYVAEAAPWCGVRAGHPASTPRRSTAPSRSCRERTGPARRHNLRPVTGTRQLSRTRVT